MAFTYSRRISKNAFESLVSRRVATPTNCVTSSSHRIIMHSIWMTEKEATRNGTSSIGSTLLLSVPEGGYGTFTAVAARYDNKYLYLSREKPTLHRSKPGSLYGIAQHHPEIGSTESLMISVFGST